MPRPDRRALLIDRLTDHLLAQGLAGASLRPMAAAAGTSDRMLLYYFADREALLGVVLEHVAARMAQGLEAHIAPAARPYATLLTDVRAALRDPALRAYMHLWLEVAARAGRGEALYQSIGERIANAFLAWAASRLDVDDSRRLAQAALLLATVDGLALLDSVGLTALADAAIG